MKKDLQLGVGAKRCDGVGAAWHEAVEAGGGKPGREAVEIPWLLKTADK